MKFVLALCFLAVAVVAGDSSSSEEERNVKVNLPSLRRPDLSTLKKIWVGRRPHGEIQQNNRNPLDDLTVKWAGKNENVKQLREKLGKHEELETLREKLANRSRDLKNLQDRLSNEEQKGRRADKKTLNNLRERIAEINKDLNKLKQQLGKKLSKNDWSDEEEMRELKRRLTVETQKRNRKSDSDSSSDSDED